MPYVETENKIKTKVIGIASKLDDGQNVKVKQVLLEDIAKNPSIVSMIYLQGRKVMISLNSGRQMYLGDIRAKYEKLLLDNNIRVASWEITGGQSLPQKSTEILGQEVPFGYGIQAKRGMNIHIELLS